MHDHPHPISFKQQSYAFIVLALLVFLCCLAGITSRPLSFLAFFWPANAFLLGCFLRFPQLNQFGGWLGACSGYILADLVTGNHLALTLFLTLSNIISVSVSLFFIQYFRINYLSYHKGLTFLALFCICALGGCLASATFAVFTIPHVPNTFMSTDRLWIDFGMWWTGEMLNCILILPLVLACPNGHELKIILADRRKKQYRLSDISPLLSIIVCVSLTYFLSGPGALLYPLAALIWAALVYQIFTITLINTFVLLTTYHSLNSFYLNESADSYLATAISVRIGLCMLSLAPLVLCIISRNRQLLYKRVLYLANHDGLTQAMNRRYFFERGEKILAQAKTSAFSIVMLDIDYFKQLNDRYGHHIGDLVLQHFSALIQQNLRDHDLFARIGGEEFVILLQDISANGAHNIANRLRYLIESTSIETPDGQHIHITASLGITHQHLPQQHNLQNLMNQADQALYQAKNQGRNQVIVAP